MLFLSWGLLLKEVLDWRQKLHIIWCMSFHKQHGIKTSIELMTSHSTNKAQLEYCMLFITVLQEDHKCGVRLFGCSWRCCAAADVTRRDSPWCIKLPCVYTITPNSIPLDFKIRARLPFWKNILKVGLHRINTVSSVLFSGMKWQHKCLHCEMTKPYQMEDVYLEMSEGVEQYA